MTTTTTTSTTTMMMTVTIHFHDVRTHEMFMRLSPSKAIMTLALVQVCTPCLSSSKKYIPCQYKTEKKEDPEKKKIVSSIYAKQPKHDKTLKKKERKRLLTQSAVAVAR